MTTLVMNSRSNVVSGAESKSEHRSALLNLTGIDAADEQDEMLQKCRTYVASLLAGVSPPEIASKLQHVCLDTASHNDVMLGLLAKILVEPTSARMGFHNLSLLNRDGFALVIRHLERVIMDKFSKLNEQPRQQLVWLVGEMVKTGGKGVMGSDKLVLALLRNIEGGSLETSNIWLAENVLDLLQDNRSWLEDKQPVLCTALYTYLRLIVDHTSPALLNLRMAEVDFCISLLRNQFSDCLSLGRDLVRLLQALSRIPEFNQLWTDIIQNPQSLSPHFTGLSQLLELRTPRRYIACRLTPDMETKLNFLLSKVSMGQQKRYQEWFHSQFLSSGDRQTLIADLVRYICCCVHPSNEILASNIVPRWAIIGWLLLSCQNNVTASYAKLALFYDWMFYKPAHPEENIMNVEPGLLVMSQSLIKHPQMTATLLDFLCRISCEFHPTVKEAIGTSITDTFQDCLEKGVIQNLAALFADDRIDPELKGLIYRSFPKFAVAAAKPQPSSAAASSTLGDGGYGSEHGNAAGSGYASHMDSGDALRPGPRHASNLLNSNKPGLGTDNAAPGAAAGSAVAEDVYDFASRASPTHGELVVAGNDEDDEMDGSGDGADDACFSDEDPTPASDGHSILTDVVAKTPALTVDSLAPALRKAMTTLSEATELLNRCRLIRTVLDTFAKQATPSDLTTDHAASSLAFCVRGDFANACCESNPDQGDEIPSVLFRHCVALSSQASAPSTVIRLLSTVQQYIPSLGYRLLYYLHLTKSSCDVVYRQYALCFGDVDLLSCLERDLKLCQEEDPITFYALIPCVFSVFAEVTVGSSILLYLLVSSIDSVQLHELVCDVSLGKFQLFGYSGLLDVVQASLEWEMFEQYFVWQLLAAEGCSVKELLPLLSELDAASNAEPVTGLLFILKQKVPDASTAAALLRCQADIHHIAPCVFHHWARCHSFALASLFTELLRGTMVNDEYMEASVEDMCKHLKLLVTLLPENNPVLQDPSLRQVLTGQYTAATAGIGDKRSSTDDYEPTAKRSFTPGNMVSDRERRIED